MGTNYRSEIDGPRALAVVSVVLFHANAPGFSGGYVGVDVFLVISGYLITSIILTDIDRFSIWRFYERRVRRIFPALFVCVALCLVVGYFLLLPFEYKEVAESALATTFFSSNIFFWKSSGYFDTAAEFSVLLHTWSLSVEEQFYLVYPVFFLLVACHAGRFTGHFVVVGLCVSFVLSVWGLKYYPPASFFLAPSRAWEFLMGAVLALGLLPHLCERYRDLAAGMGLALIVWSVTDHSTETTFPGAAALAPTLGAVLIIYAGSATVVARTLSLRGVVFVGLISYSLYLFHWPIFVFLRYHFLTQDLPASVTIAAIALSVLLATLSWRMVERPFRTIVSGRVVLWGSALAASASIVATVVIVRTHGVPQRLPDSVAQLTAVRASVDCGTKEAGFPQHCDIGVTNKAPSFLVWGDSHAKAIAYGIGLSAKRHAQSGALATMGGCQPLLHVSRPNGTAETACEEFRKNVMEEIKGIDTVFLVGRWAIWAEGDRYKAEPGKRVEIYDASLPEISEASHEVFSRGLSRTVEALSAAGKRVVIVGPVPEIGWNVPRSMAMAEMFVARRHFAPHLDEFLGRQAFVLDQIAEHARIPNVTAVYPHTILCDRTCAVEQDGYPLYSDDNHLNTLGAKRVQTVFDPVFAQRQ